MITVKIGDSEVQYQLVETTAPTDYDQFGTFTLEEIPATAKNRKRIVLVDQQHLDSQVARYASGMYRAEVWPETRLHGSMRRYIEETLWKKLAAEPPKEDA